MRRVLTALALGLATGLIVTACGKPPHPPEQPPRTAAASIAERTTTTSSSTTTTTAPAPPPLPSTTSRPAPAPVTTPPRPTTTACPPDIVALIHTHWDRFGPDVVQWAIGIAWRESNCRPDVTSSSGCAGIFQMSPVHAGLFTANGYSFHPDAWNAEPNIAVAATLYASSGPSPWRL